jgi:hypothetical protein
MKAGLVSPLLALFLASLVSACAPYRPDSVHAGTCNQLNSNLIFNGNTSNIREAEIQDAQDPLIQHNYDRKCD